MKKAALFISITAIILAALWSSGMIGHYGSGQTLNAGMWVGCVGLEYKGTPGLFDYCAIE